MKTVTTEYAAQHLEALLDEVADGEEILICVEDRPIAKLMPVAKHADDRAGYDAETPVEEVEQAFYGD